MKVRDAGATIIAIVFIALIGGAAADKNFNRSRVLKQTGAAIDSVMCPISQACTAPKGK